MSVPPYSSGTVMPSTPRSPSLRHSAIGNWSLRSIFGLGLVVAIVDGLIGFALGGVPVVGRVITSAIDTAFGAYTIVVLAILYESQRLRVQPPPAVVYPSAPYDPEGPYPPPPPPPPAQG